MKMLQPAKLKPLAAAVRVAFFSMLAMGVISHAHAQTASPANQGAASDVSTLSEVKVTAERNDTLPRPYAGGQVARGGRLGLLGNTDLMKSPFSVSSYTSKAIQDQQAATVADVLAKDPSIRTTGQSGGILDAFFIRGFPIGEGNLGEIAFDGQYGVAPNYRVLNEYVERIEVIKGPAALLYGMSPSSGIGGVINVVPKRATVTDLTRFTANYGSDSHVGGHLDLSRRFGSERQFGVRFNGSHHQGDTPLDNQSREANVGAVALDYQGERLRATLDVIDQRERFDAPSRPFLVASGVAVPSAPDGQRNVTQAWEWAKIDDRSVLLRAEYDLNDDLTFFASAGGGDTNVARLFGTPTIINEAGDTRTTQPHSAPYRFNIERLTSDAGMRIKFNTAAIRHTVTLQASAYSDRMDRGFNNGTAVSSNIYAPVARPQQNVTAPSQVPKISETDLTGVALADTLSMLDDRVQLMLGARHQQVKSDNFSTTTGAVTSSYDKSAVTPLVGIVYKPSQQISLYANHIEGLSKGDIAPDTAAGGVWVVNAGEVFAPYKSKQNEIGVKFDHGRLTTTMSVFQIEKPSGQSTILPGNVSAIYAVDGEQRNRGVELNAFGELSSSVRLMGGVTWLDAELTKTNSSVTLGKTPVGVPSLQANLGIEWDTPWLPGLTLTGSTAYTGKQYVNQANTQRIPSWTRVDLGARYSTRLAGKATTFRANILNAFDRDYWSGVASYGGFVQGAPRTVLLSAAIDF